MKSIIKFFKDLLIDTVKGLFFKQTSYTDTKTHAFINSFAFVWMLSHIITHIINIINNKKVEVFAISAPIIYLIILIGYWYIMRGYTISKKRYHAYYNEVKEQSREMYKTYTESAESLIRHIDQVKAYNIFNDPYEQKKSDQYLDNLKKDLNLYTKEDDDKPSK